jgi:hypothetical protein
LVRVKKIEEDDNTRKPTEILRAGENSRWMRIGEETADWEAC